MRVASPKVSVFAPDEVLDRRYRIVQFLAKGGMGEVYEAEDLQLRERVALKTINSGSTDTSAIDRFKREIALARKVTHPNVCRIFDLGQHGPDGGSGVTFLTMELLKGETLSKCLRRRGKFSTREALPIASQVSEALDAAHRARIVHRDLKSENIFLVREAGMARAVVTDFGIARGGFDDQFAAMVTGVDIVGTPAYMAPEQVEGKPVTAAADVYAFGVVIYEMVTGRLPFESDNPITTAAKRLQEPPRPPRVLVPELDERWEQVILCCLERHPEQRFPSAGEAVRALQLVASQSTQSFPTQSRSAQNLPAQNLPTQNLPAQTSTTPTQGSPSASPGAMAPSAHLPPTQIITQTSASQTSASQTSASQTSASQTSASQTSASQTSASQTSASPGSIPNVAALPTPNPLHATAIYPVKKVGRGSTRPLLMTLGVVVLLSAGLYLFNWWRGDGARRAPRQSIAVVGLRDMSDGQQDQAWLATALAEMLGTELARGDRLRTISGDQVARAKQELELANSTDLSEEGLRKLNALLGCDFVVTGGFLPAGEQLRIELRLSDAAVGKQLKSFAQNGDEADLFNLVQALGREVRERLGVKEGQMDMAKVGLPRDRQARRLYVEALDSLRQFDALSARDSLQEASRLEPENPLIHSALSSAWQALGHGGRASEAARKAFENSSDLSQEDRLLINGRYRETEGNWAMAMQVYQELLDYFPNEVEYGLRLASAQTSARRPTEALASIARLRGLEPAPSEAVRIDLAEAAAAAVGADFALQLEAAERGAVKARELGAVRLEADAWMAVAQAHRFLGQSQQSLEAVGHSRRLFDQISQESGSAQALVSMAHAYFDLAKFDDAIARAEEAMGIFKGLGDEGGVASALNTLALGFKKKGDLEKAQVLYEQAQTTLESTGNQLALATALNNRAAILIVLDQLDEADEMFDRARSIWEKSRDSSGQASALSNGAHVLRLQGKLTQSRTANEQALAIRRRIGQKNTEVFSLLNLGGLLADIGDLTAAETHLEEARKLAEEMGHRSALGYCLYELGHLRLVQGRLEDARGLYDEALAIRQELKERQPIAETQAALARLKLERGESANAELHARHAIDAFHEDGLKAGEGEARALLALALADQRLQVEARRELADAKEMGADSQRFVVRFRIRFAEASLAAAQGQPRGARQLFQEIETEAAEAGFEVLEFEAQLRRLLIDQRAGRRSEADRQLALLGEEATTLGMGWIRGKVVAALQ